MGTGILLRISYDKFTRLQRVDLIKTQVLRISRGFVAVRTAASAVRLIKSTLCLRVVLVLLWSRAKLGAVQSES